jgi:hypothetical protein
VANKRWFCNSANSFLWKLTVVAREMTDNNEKLWPIISNRSRQNIAFSWENNNSISDSSQ